MPVAGRLPRLSTILGKFAGGLETKLAEYSVESIARALA